MRALAFITLGLARTALIAFAGLAILTAAVLAAGVLSAAVFVVSVLVTGVVLATPAAIAGAARTETASSAAEMVFSMVVSLWDLRPPVGWPGSLIMGTTIVVRR